MAVDNTALSACKLYMRVDDSNDDALIIWLMQAAKTYLTKAGAPAPATADASYDLAVWALTLYWYDHRSEVGKAPESAQGLITQLKLSPLPAPVE